MSESSLFELFIEETREHLEKIDEALLLLEKEPENKELINALFRSVHTIKGSTAAMSYSKTSELIHKVEDLIHLLREDKLKVNQKIIQLLFVTHDFLERFLEVVLNNGNEHELKSEHILQEVQSFLSEESKGEESNQKTIQQTPANLLRLTIGADQMERFLREMDVEEGIYLIRIKLSSDCVFKSIRVWMIFEELDKWAQVITSFPQKPSMDDFKNGTFNFEEQEVMLVVASYNQAQMAEAIEQLSEIDHYDISQLEMTDPQRVDYDKLNRQYSFRLEPNAQDLVESIIDFSSKDEELDYPPGFLDEIKENADKAKNSLKNYGENLLFDYNKLYRYFHTAKGLGDYIEHVLIQELAGKTESLVDYLRKNPAEANRDMIDGIHLSSIYITVLCEDPKAVQDKERADKVNDHLQWLLKQNKQKEIQPHESQGQKESVYNQEMGQGQNVEQDRHAHPEKSKDDQGETIQKALQTEVHRVSANTTDVLENHSETGLNAEKTVDEKKEVPKKEQSFIRIPENKIDYLVDMLGELIIFQSQHKQEVFKAFEEHGVVENKAINSITKMERITKELQTLSMSLRMVSLKQTLQKLARIGRDTGLELGKTININIQGEDTEIDRSVVEKIQDPLMHLVRNAIGHGLEEDDQRMAVGKELPGQVTVNAYNRRGSVYIEVADDGKGLNLDKIYQKAVENRLITPDKEYTEEEIAHFIFLPGLSTQDKLNAISGRGVGMNVVETEVKKIGGKIEIRNRPGQGCTFILKIPINLATISGTIVDMCGQRFIIPTVNIKHIFKPRDDEWVAIKGKTEYVKLRNQLISLIPIAKITNTNCHVQGKSETVVIILEMDNELRALPVSGIVGKQEIVQKPLGDEFASAKIFSGGTILGDGKVCLILDIDSIFNLD